MFLRQLRWIAAVVVAVGALPASSRADTQILVQEVDSSGNAVGELSTFFQSGNGSFNLPSSFLTPSFNVTSIGATPTNFSGSGTLSTTVITTPTSSFNPTHSLRVTVTSDGFFNPTPGGAGNLVNDPGISASRTVDANSNTGTTEFLTGPIGGTTSPFTPALVLTDTQVSGGGDALSSTAVPSVPGQYTIRQTLLITITPTGSLNGTFTDTLSSSLDASPPPVGGVPAPAGLVLALTALPVLGLRRTLRKRTVV